MAGAFCAQYWIRTSTTLRSPPPQGGASTNFANWAIKRTSLQIYSNCRVCSNKYGSLRHHYIINIASP